MKPFHRTRTVRIASVIAAGTMVFGVSACSSDDEVDEVENEVDEVEGELDEVESELDEVESELQDP